MGLKPRARVVAMAVTGSEPTIMLVGPTPATRKVLARAGLTVEDIDLFELNEAFASVVMKWMRDPEIPEEKVNVNGGAIAMGHPLGATGAMIVGTLLDELEARDSCATGWHAVSARAWASPPSSNESEAHRRHEQANTWHIEKHPVSGDPLDNDRHGVVILTIDDPAASVNTMNEAFTRSMEASVAPGGGAGQYHRGDPGQRQEDFLRRRGPEPPAPARASRAAEQTAVAHRPREGADARAGAAGQAGGRGDQRDGARRRARGGLCAPTASRGRAGDHPRAAGGDAGLLPGGGGIVRMVRLLGHARLRCEGDPARGHSSSTRRGARNSVGLRRSRRDAGGAARRARAWIKANPGAQQPWDRQGLRDSRRHAASPAMGPMLPMMPRRTCARRPGAPMPAPRRSSAAAVEGTQVDFDSAMRIETRWFISLVMGTVARNMINTFFFQLQTRSRRGDRSPEGRRAREVQAKKVGVLGAGMMGAGIALRLRHARARGGAEGRDACGGRRARATRRRSSSRRQLAKGKLTQEQARRHAGADPADRKRRRLRGAATWWSRRCSRTASSRRA
jgi:hypothetical protein